MIKFKRNLKKIILCFVLLFFSLTIQNEVQAEIKFPQTSTVGIDHDTDIYEGTLDKIIELNGKQTIRKATDNYKVIAKYLKNNGYVSNDISEDELNEYIEENAGLIKVTMSKFGDKISNTRVDDCLISKTNNKPDTDSNQKPDSNSSSSSGSGSGSGTLDDMFDAADDFFNTGLNNEGKVINIGNLQVTSNFVYNVLLAIAIVVAVIWGLILGIQFLVGAAEQKAETKKALAPYLIGCAVVFGAFGIWAFVVNILQSIE